MKIMFIDYEDYTMWIEREEEGWTFNREWEDGQSEEQVLKEWKESLQEAVENGAISAELRKHSDYHEDEDGITSNCTKTIASWPFGIHYDEVGA
tara:strand:+ start:343 stop:624 length:282 start_codon:yes stop_codon:yes gene_type:complete